MDDRYKPLARSNQTILRSLLQQRNYRTFDEAAKKDPRVAVILDGVNALQAICWSQVSNEYLQLARNETASSAYKQLSDILMQIVPAGKKSGYWIKLINEYNQALLDKKLLIGSSQLTAFNRTTNIIDARYLAYMNEDLVGLHAKDEIQEFRTKHGIYSALPCFETGGMQITDDVTVYWTINNIQFDKKCFEMTVIIASAQTNLNDTPSVGTKVSISLRDDGVFAVERFEAKISTMEAYLTLLSPKKIWSSKEDRNNFTRIFLKFAKIIDGNTSYGEIDEFMSECISIFNSYITYINYLLTTKKVSSAKRGLTATKKLKSVDNFNQEEQDARKVRMLDVVQFTSVKVPRAPSEATVRTYSVASWSVRGHIRHCANGKDVYVKPHINTRHCIDKAKEQTPAPRTIVVDNSIVR